MYNISTIFSQIRFRFNPYTFIHKIRDIIIHILFIFNFVSRNFPLTSIHQNALISAQAAEAAGGQGKYWEMYDLLYENQNEWAKSTDPLAIFAKYATGLKIDVERFKNEVQSGAYQNIINQDLADARSLGINSTPTFFLNGVKMLGVQNIEDLKARINQALAE